MRNPSTKNEETTSCCEVMYDGCYHEIKCNGNRVVCISEVSRCSTCSETEDTDDEYENDVLSENSTSVYRMPRRRNSEPCIVDNKFALLECCNGEKQCTVKVNNQNFCQENVQHLGIAYTCVSKRADCLSMSTSARPRTSKLYTTQKTEALTTTGLPVTTPTLSPATSTVTSFTIFPETASTVSRLTSTTPVQPYTRSSTSSSTGSTQSVRAGNKDDRTIMDTSSIVGITLGSVALLVLIILIIILLQRKRKGFRMENKTSGQPNVGNSPHYFTIEFPNNQYDEINDISSPDTNEYNTLGEDNSVKTSRVDNYDLISSAFIAGQVGLTNDGYNHIVLANDNSPQVLNNDYNHINFETGDYNLLRGQNSFKNPKADNYHHILSPGSNE